MIESLFGTVKQVELELMLCIRIVVAFVCGGAIGLQRRNAKNRDTSILRTHIIICVTASLIACMSEVLAITYTGIDVTRISAQIISGVGFLGIGVIVRQGNTVNGLTTAATLWAVGAIGMAIGSGCFIIGFASTVIFLLLLMLTRRQ